MSPQLQNPDFTATYLTNARLQPGSGSSNPCPSPLPPWISPQLIHEGQSFIHRNFFSIFFAHFISLLFLLCYSPVRSVLLQTGQSDTSWKALRRYISTLIHIKGWYEGDLIEGAAAADVTRIRKIHSRIGQGIKKKMVTAKIEVRKTVHANSSATAIALRKDLSKLNNNNNNSFSSRPLPGEPKISQLDMTVTQFCFMGFIAKYPRVFGIREETPVGLDGFIHVWALIGHLIGIEDEFNLGLEVNAPARGMILSQVLVGNFQECDPDTLRLWKSLADGVAKIIPCISLNAILLYVTRDLLDLKMTIDFYGLGEGSPEQLAPPQYIFN